MYTLCLPGLSLFFCGLVWAFGVNISIYIYIFIFRADLKGENAELPDKYMNPLNNLFAEAHLLEVYYAKLLLVCPLVIDACSNDIYTTL
jgi:hypothetical protein